MNLELTISPFSSHDNILYGFIKKSLVDGHIYDDSDIAFPYTKIQKKYQLQLTECYEEVEIYFNDILYLEFDGTFDDDTYNFYVMPVFGNNEIKVLDLSGNLKVRFNFNCYNIHVFLALSAKYVKVIWNKLQQALANTYYDENLVQDLDEVDLVPEDRYTRAVAKLLNTERYSELTNSQYYTFLHNVFDAHVYGGVLNGFYQIQEALPDYINRIDMIPIEKYLPFRNELYGKVFYDTTNSQNIKVFPTYHYFPNTEWGIINYVNEKPDTSGTVYVYIDGEKETDGTDIDSLKVKYTNDPEFYREELEVTDSFGTDDIQNDGSGVYTGFIDSKFVILTQPNIDGTISVDSTGSIVVDDSAELKDDDYNIVSLGTRYSSQITNIDITYQSYNIPPFVLAKLGVDTTSEEVSKIYLSGQADTDAAYLSYKENNYGVVVLVIRLYNQIDNELQGIINGLLREILPIHLKYYLVWSTMDIWNYWGETSWTIAERFSDGTTDGTYPDIKFYDLK